MVDQSLEEKTRKKLERRTAQQKARRKLNKDLQIATSQFTSLPNALKQRLANLTGGGVAHVLIESIESTTKKWPAGLVADEFGNSALHVDHGKNGGKNNELRQDAAKQNALRLQNKFPEKWTRGYAKWLAEQTGKDGITEITAKTVQRYIKKFPL